MVIPYLDELESRLSRDVEEAFRSEWTTFLNGACRSPFFSVRRGVSAPPNRDWPVVSVNAALDDAECMAMQQFAACSAALTAGDGSILNIRPNFGTGILPSLFGAAPFRMDEAMNTLPTSRPLPGGADAIRRLLDRGGPDLYAGDGGRCFARADYFLACMADYPKVSRYVHIYHPDLQGPMDACELILGSDLFLILIDEPDLVKALLDLVTETMVRFLREWYRRVPPRDAFLAHWGMLLKGRIMIRDDSAMNLSPAMFDEFIAPYDRKLLRELGGGGIHFCGRGDHYIDRLAGMDGLFAVNLSQPEYNDMETVFRHTIDRGVPLVGLPRAAAECALARGRSLHGLVHVR